MRAEHYYFVRLSVPGISAMMLKDRGCHRKLMTILIAKSPDVFFKRRRMRP